MKEVVLSIKKPLKVPVLAEISPDMLQGKTISQIENIKVWEGNKEKEMSKIFDVDGEADVNIEDLTIRIVDDAHKVRMIGRGMTGGTIVAKGSVGMYLGYEMSGGEIVVYGDAGSWVGSKMKGGSIEVKGNTSDFIGSAYRGSKEGMIDGLIIVHGEAGSEVGCWMRGGTIKIDGKSGMFPGMHMVDGTIYIGGICEGRAGAGMTNGKVVISGHIPSILPSFSIEEIKEKVKIASKEGKEKIKGPFYVFQGDNNELGNGRLYADINMNPQLKWCNEYLEDEG